MYITVLLCAPLPSFQNTLPYPPHSPHSPPAVHPPCTRQVKSHGVPLEVVFDDKPDQGDAPALSKRVISANQAALGLSGASTGRRSKVRNGTHRNPDNNR